MNDVFIIAEVGINHNGDLTRAKEMVLAAKECGADCVKFQTFKAEEFVSDPEQMYTYQSQGKTVTESMLNMFKRYEFTKIQWKEIVSFCQSNDILFSSTAQNKTDMTFLMSICDLPFIKVGSDDLTNLKLLEYYAQYNKPMIISAGMAYAYEIDNAVRSIRSTGNDKITVLHCVSSYPTQPQEVNLKKIPVIRDCFGVKVGFSDHTEGSVAAVGAVCFGAQVIEKHFTLDKTLPGPDHWFSSDIKDFKEYIAAIRYIKKSIGVSTLGPTVKELAMRKIARRKIVVTSDMHPGDMLTSENLTFKRSEQEGIAPEFYEYVLNRRVAKEKFANDTIVLEDLYE